MTLSNKLYKAKYFKTLTTIIGSMESAIIIINWTTFIFIWFLFTSSHFSHQNKCVWSKSSNSVVNLGEYLEMLWLFCFLGRILARLGIFAVVDYNVSSWPFKVTKANIRGMIVSFCDSTAVSFSVSEIFSLADQDQGSQCSQRSALFSAR